MKSQEREILLQSRGGDFELYNLWEFWDGITKKDQIQLLDYFEKTPLMFDYKTLFKGQFSGKDIDRGPIHYLTLLLSHSSQKDFNLEYFDYFFSKFCQYNPTNYISNSKWGLTWENEKDNNTEIKKDVIKNNEDENQIEDINIYNMHLSSLENYKKLKPNDVYWKDTHFFMIEYSKAVYRKYLNGECDINRFIVAANFSLINIDIIKSSISTIMGWDKGLHNPVIEQYLIYLEKHKMFKECVEIIIRIKDKGWRNEFEKRLSRCHSKIKF